ncbi:septum site-determining protein Ssd [Mumia sp.]|uniref:septum site-determining protein Ssd n=1 Tax=Mumia sp. TaxID=1965300 RepID=UPI0026173EEA|nr:septum site-determining protein Ssd [Mumia sp.]MDD9348109.1 septum site-determining protein [Mumia sp.]
MPASYATAPSRPLLVTASEQILDAVLRLCAGAGVEPVVCSEVGAARSLWSTASVVVLGDDVLGPRAAPAPERRPDVWVVAVADPLPATWSTALAVGAEAVLVLPRDDDTLAEVLVDRADGGAGDAPVLAFVGGCGGAGASSLAAAVALCAAADRRGDGGEVLLVDGDPVGGGLDLLLGDEDAAGLRWGDLASTHGRLSGAALRRSLPRSGGLAVLSWERGLTDPARDEVVRSVLTAVRRVHDLVVVDLPRHLDDAAAEIVTRAAVLVVVVPADVRAVGAATGVVRRVSAWATDVRVVVRRRRGALPSDVVADALDLPLLATVGEDPRFRRAVEEGVGPVARHSSVRAAARSVWASLGPEIAA